MHLSRKNETKIVKVTYSAVLTQAVKSFIGKREMFSSKTSQENCNAYLLTFFIIIVGSWSWLLAKVKMGHSNTTSSPFFVLGLQFLTSYILLPITYKH